MSDALGVWWRIAKESKIPIDRNLSDLKSFPHTITQVILNRMQIDMFMELPKDERPPMKIWDDREALKDWFDRLSSPGKETGLQITLEEIEK